MFAALVRPFLPSLPSSSSRPSTNLPSSSTRPARPPLRQAASLALLRPTPSLPTSTSSTRPTHRRTQSAASSRSVKSSPTSPLAAADVQAQAVFDTEGMSASASLKRLSKVESRGRGRRRGSSNSKLKKRRLPGNWSSESDDEIPPVPPLPLSLSRAGPSTAPAAAGAESSTGKYPAPPSLAHSSTSSLSSAVHTPTSPAPGLPSSSSSPTTPNTSISISSTKPTSVSPARPPVILSPPRPLPRPQKLNPTWATLDPYLAALEHKAKLVPPSRCSVCATKGRGFPACPRCGVEWCSRECRTEDLARRGVKRHACSKGKQPEGAERVASVGLQAALVRC
ncbi:hypothetical protein CALVIDRAFT_527225 [Calocera viscosa TUFC12733]|uniref:Uncharacterized protein n=1 Tax=Calocera viscosa (strain TUFC12733) TaxID=1330018 RepID=A0A167MQ09_CALVF|nr:hypothetical protein CALVIDRAFT_527225 [Calocera viscosa TUFC12733]